MSITLVVVVPLLTAAILLAFWTKPHIRKFIAIAGSIIHFFSGVDLFFQVSQKGIIEKYLGNWQPPFGISFHADMFSALLVLVTCTIGITSNIYSFENLDKSRRDYGFHPLFFVLLAGVCGAFVTSDLFNLFVWFECILLSSFVLLSLGGTKDQIRGAINYVVPNLFASMIFLAGLGLIYGITGTLNMQDVARIVPELPVGNITLISLLFLVAFGIKAAFFPLFSWLPTSYHTAPTTITALFAGLLTKVGVYALFRFFTTVVPLQSETLVQILLYGSIGTMAFGILGAIAQKDVKRVLAFHIISQIGYMTAGLAMQDQMSVSAGIFYMIHHIIVITNLFFCAGIMEYHLGTSRRAKMGGLLKKQPLLALVFAIPMFSLAGLPPFSGFWAKFALLKVSLAQDEIFLTVVMLGTSILTLYSMIKIWSEVFWKDRPNPEDEKAEVHNQPPAKYGPAILLSIITAVISLAPIILFNATDKAATQLTPDWPKVNAITTTQEETP